MSSTTNRFRQTDRLNASTWRIRDYSPAGALQSDTSGVHSSKSSGTYKHIHDCSGMSHREFEQVIKSGGIVNHPMQLEHQERSIIPCQWTIGPHPVWGRREVIADVACVESRPPSGSDWTSYLGYLAEDADRALVEAYAKANSPDALARVMWKEREKTAHLIGNVASRFSDFLERDDVIPELDRRMSRVIGNPAKARRTFYSWWLGVRFGVRPLIADAQSIAKAAANSIENYTGKWIIYRGGVNRTFNGSYTRDNVSTYGGVDVSLVGKWHEDAKTSAGVFVSLKDANHAVWLNRNLGLSADSQPRTVWEELPYSFVADYFYKIGPWIDASTPSPYLVYGGDWVTQVRKQENSCTVTGGHKLIAIAPVTDYRVGGGGYYEKLEYVSRSTDEGVPLLPPSVGKPLSFAQAVDIAALAFQRLEKNLKHIDGFARI